MKKRMFCLSVLLLLFGATIAQNAADLKLIQQYENAIKKSPNKSELYDTLGILYNALGTEALQGGNKEKAQENFLKAEKNFLLAIQKNTRNFTANFSLGVLYYNEALALSKQLMEQDLDFSAAAKASYEAQKTKNAAQYKKALPFFKKAESIDPNDLQTLFALKSIFGQLEDNAMMDIFKGRMKVVQDGGQHAAAYFK